MAKFLAIFLGMFLAFSGFAEARAKRYSSDAKFPTQKMIEYQAIDNPAAAGTADVLSANDGPSSGAAASVSTFVAQPDVPRNLVITPGSTTADVAACTVTVAGTNIFDQSISEDFAFLANASTATTGTKAFKTVSSVSWAASCEDSPYGATWSVGYGEKLGLNKCLDAAGYWLQSLVSGVYESTRATVVADADEVEKNTADFNGTMNGNADFVALYIQNYRCQR